MIGSDQGTSMGERVGDWQRERKLRGKTEIHDDFIWKLSECLVGRVFSITEKKRVWRPLLSLG